LAVRSPEYTDAIPENNPEADPVCSLRPT